MKRSGFKKLTLEEIKDKQRKAAERRSSKPVSKVAEFYKERRNTKNKDKYRKETEWKKIIRLRDNHTCQYPGCKYKDVHIHCHHIAPRSQRKDLLYEISNGICVCPKHHQWIHDNPIEAVKLGLLSKETRELAEKANTIHGR